MKDQWIERGEGAALDALESAVARLTEVVTKFARMKAAERSLRYPDGTPFRRLQPGTSGYVDEGGVVHEDEVRREMARLGRKFHGTRSALRRAAVTLVKSRRKGLLDGAHIYAAGPGDEPGPRVNGKLLRPHRKKPRLT